MSDEKERMLTIEHGDSLEILREMPDESVDSIVTDPPAGIDFMGKGWDSDKGGRDNWIAWLREIMVEGLRVLKPGGHALVWAIPRTSHWTATAVEDAGFEIRDVVNHLFGTGFPKSLNVQKVVEEKEPERADDFEGWGTALKPAAEHWILARKPLCGTVAANVLKHGTGGLNVDGCRIGTEERRNGPASTVRVQTMGRPEHSGSGWREDYEGSKVVGRWPANVVLDEEAAAALDAQSGISKDGIATNRNRGARIPSTVNYANHDGQDHGYGGSGGASRFFYVAKPSTAERDEGLEAFAARSGGEATGRKDGSDGLKSPRAGAGRTGNRKNVHPTVKSVALMRWLCRLITPPGGLVLDPFAGSGSTGCACAVEGFDFVGIEREAEYVEIARARLARWLEKAEKEQP